MPGKSEFVCDSCGRRFSWKPAIAGKKAKCKCGAILNIPTEDPAAAVADSGGFELDLPDDLAPPPPTVATPASRCINCNHPLKPGAVICLNCGTDQRTGSKVQTGVEELDAKTRRKANLAAKLPLWSMRVLQVGMWCNLVGVLLVIVGLVGLFGSAALATSNPALADLGLIIAVVIELLGLGLVLIGPLLCVAVPSESDARSVLIVSILLSGSSMGINIAAEFTTLPWWLPTIASVLSTAATLCFLYFLLMLSKYLDFGSVYELAEKTTKVYFWVVLCTLGLFVPIVSCFVVLAWIGLSIYGFILYVILLIAMNQALSIRIREMR
ncbi:MAG: hypothetical protein AAF823_00080 [Planctomycetota bacterium]